MYEIIWMDKARRQVEKFRNQADQDMIYAAATELVLWPDVRQIKKLIGHQYSYRLRAGRYRIFFDVKNEVQIVSIEEVKKRDESTY